MSDIDYTIKPIYEHVSWDGGVRWDRGRGLSTTGVVFALEGMARIFICQYVGQCRLLASYIYNGRMHQLVRTRKLLYTTRGAARIVKRWMREIYRNDLVDW